MRPPACCARTLNCRAATGRGARRFTFDVARHRVTDRGVEQRAAFGVEVDSGDHNEILSNAVFANGLGGIFLNATNHANDDLAAPVLTAALSSGSISGTISGADGTYTLEFFSNAPAADAQPARATRAATNDTRLTTMPPFLPAAQVAWTR